jgi:hypothetical protein
MDQFKLLGFSGTKSQYQQSSLRFGLLAESISWSYQDLNQNSEISNFLVPKLNLSISDVSIQIARIFWYQKSISAVFLKIWPICCEHFLVLPGFE